LMPPRFEHEHDDEPEDDLVAVLCVSVVNPHRGLEFVTFPRFSGFFSGTRRLDRNGCLDRRVRIIAD
jgi:hypothetical protein